MSSTKKGKLNQKIHIGMMEVLEDMPAPLDQTFTAIATNEFPQPAVLQQISNTSQSYVSLSDKTDLEVNLVESETKDILFFFGKNQFNLA